MVHDTAERRGVKALPMVTSSPVARKRGPDYVPVVSQQAARDLATRCLAAGSLAGAAVILREFAEGLPPTPVRNMVQRPGWRETLMRCATKLAQGKPYTSILAMHGNVKLPFVAFSALPFHTCPGMGECADWCYSVRAWRYPGGFARQLQNTLLLRHKPSLVKRAFLALDPGVTFRLYVDGDFQDLTTVRFWMTLLEARPDLQAYGYSKSWEALWAYGQRHTWPGNYVLNLSSGGRPQRVSLEQIRTLPIVRNRFLAVEVDYRPAGGKRGRVGNERYADPAYHAAVREAARKQGLGKVFSCPGKCGSCSPHGHVCGSHRFDMVTVAIGVH